MKRITVIFLILALSLAGCSGGNKGSYNDGQTETAVYNSSEPNSTHESVNNTTGTESPTDLPETTQPEATASGNAPANDILDTLAEGLGDTPWLGHYIYFDEEPDAYSFYLDGMDHSSPGVRWYCAYNIFKFETEDRKKEIIDKLDKLKNDPVEQVRNAAGFSLEIINRTFGSDVFCKSPDGQKIAFVRYNELLYRDFEVYVFDINKNSCYVLDKMDGGSFGFNWSPDSKKLALMSGGRTWINCAVIHLETNEKQSPDVFGYIEEHKLDLGLKTVKLFGYQSIQAVEWNPSSTKLLLAYGFINQDDYSDNSGTAVYDLEKDVIEKVTKDTEGNCYPELKVPEGFKW